MRLDLRLHGRTASGQKCQADVSVYAASQKDFMKEADNAARSAAWIATDPPHDPIPEGSEITVESVEKIWPHRPAWVFPVGLRVRQAGRYAPASAANPSIH